MSDFSLWSEVTYDAESARVAGLVSLARQNATSLWPVVAGATNEQDFHNRMALIDDKLSAAVSSVVTEDKSDHVIVRASLVDAFLADYQVLAKHKTAADPSSLTAGDRVWWHPVAGGDIAKGTYVGPSGKGVASGFTQSDAVEVEKDGGGKVNVGAQDLTKGDPPSTTASKTASWFKMASDENWCYGNTSTRVGDDKVKCNECGKIFNGDLPFLHHEQKTAALAFKTAASTQDVIKAMQPNTSLWYGISDATDGNGLKSRIQGDGAFTGSDLADVDWNAVWDAFSQQKYGSKTASEDYFAKGKAAFEMGKPGIPDFEPFGEIGEGYADAAREWLRGWHNTNLNASVMGSKTAGGMPPWLNKDKKKDDAANPAKPDAKPDPSAPAATTKPAAPAVKDDPAAPVDPQAPVDPAADPTAVDPAAADPAAPSTPVEQCSQHDTIVDADGTAYSVVTAPTDSGDTLDFTVSGGGETFDVSVPKGTPFTIKDTDTSKADSVKPVGPNPQAPPAAPSSAQASKTSGSATFEKLDKEVCPVCNGKGRDDAFDVCKACGGHSYIYNGRRFDKTSGIVTPYVCVWCQMPIDKGVGSKGLPLWTHTSNPPWSHYPEPQTDDTGGATAEDVFGWAADERTGSKVHWDLIPVTSDMSNNPYSGGNPYSHSDHADNGGGGGYADNRGATDSHPDNRGGHQTQLPFTPADGGSSGFGTSGEPTESEETQRSSE